MSDSKAQFIEKSTDFKYFTLISSIIFSLDIFCIIVYKENIIKTFINFDSLVNTKEYVYFAVFFVIFSFLITSFFPTVRFAIKSIFLYFNKFDNLIDTNKDYKSLSSVKDEAIQKKDKFLFSLVEKEEIEYLEMEKKLNISFALGLFIVIDWLINDNSLVNFSYDLIQNTNGIFYFFYTTMSLIYLIIIAFWFHISLKYNPNKIYLP